MPKGVPKKDGSGRGRGQSGKGCGGAPRKRKGANKQGSETEKTNRIEGENRK